MSGANNSKFMICVTRARDTCNSRAITYIEMTKYFSKVIQSKTLRARVVRDQAILQKD